MVLVLYGRKRGEEMVQSENADCMITSYLTFWSIEEQDSISGRSISNTWFVESFRLLVESFHREEGRSV